MSTVFNEKYMLTVLIVILLCMILQPKIQKNDIVDKVTDQIANLFEPDLQGIQVECFGEELSQLNMTPTGYWGGAANAPTQVKSTGPPVGGTQSASYQMYQQAVNAATPTMAQLENISNLPGGGYGYVGTPDAPGLVPPAGQGTFYDAAAVDFGNQRAASLSPCYQNAPTFLSASLLPRPDIPGQPSWNVTDTQALANQNFLSATQQIGVDTVLSSNRNASRDIRNNIPNPINVVSPWQNSTITPDLMRRPLDAYVPQDGIYGCGNACTYSNQSRAPLGYM